MKKYVLYVNDLNVENIIDVADTEDEIREQQKYLDEWWVEKICHRWHWLKYLKKN